MIAGLGARVHLFARPPFRDPLMSLFGDVLGCNVRELEFGMEHPILLVSLPDGSAFSVEFDDCAVDAPTSTNDESAFRGAWIEFRVRDVVAVQDVLRARGIPQFVHPVARSSTSSRLVAKCFASSHSTTPDRNLRRRLTEHQRDLPRDGTVLNP